MINIINLNRSFLKFIYSNNYKLSSISTSYRLLSSTKLININNNHTLNRKYHIQPKSSFLNRFYSTTKAVVPESYTDSELETVESIKMLIDKRIRPVVQQDGGDVSFVSFDPSTGFVYVRLSGACVGCIQSDITLKHMIQGMLCHYVDEITAVYNVDEDNNVVTSDSNNED